MKYYYAINNQQFGPFKLEELKNHKIGKTTLVWREDMPSWIKADEVEELKEFIIPEPPPLPSNIDIIESSPKNLIVIPDENTQNQLVSNSSGYSKDSFVVVCGILIILSPLIILIFTQGENSDSSRPVLAVLAFLVRAISAYGVYNIAKLQNRDSSAWALFGFLFPGITLIIIGLKDRIPYVLKLQPGLSLNQQVSEILIIATEFSNEFRTQEAIALVNQALKLNPNNEDALMLQAKNFTDIKVYEKAFLFLKKILEINYKNQEANFQVGTLLINQNKLKDAEPYLKFAAQENHEQAKKAYRKYYELVGKYLLSEDEVNDKLDQRTWYQLQLSYVSGLKDIGSINENTKQIFYLCINGFRITIKENKHMIAILFKEIKDIIIEDSYAVLILFDETKVTIKYNTKKSSCGIENFVKEWKNRDLF